MHLNQHCQYSSKYPGTEELTRWTHQEFQHRKILRTQLSAHEAMQIFCNTEGIITGHKPLKTSNPGEGVMTN